MNPILEKDYGGWSVQKDGNLITATKTIKGSGVSQVNTLGDSNSILRSFANYPIKIRKIEANFDSADPADIEIDRVPTSTLNLKSILVKRTASTDQSHILDAEVGNVDVFSMPFKIDFTITYTLNKYYELTVMLEEMGL